jgi:threonine synthase
MPYAQVAARILKLYAGETLSAETCAAACRTAYAGFTHAAVTPLRQLDPNRWLLELFHGPTLAFKDVAMQLLARLYDQVLDEQGRTLTIVCATSGDTGGAAVEAFRGSKRVKIVALYPHGRISEVQRRFMTGAVEDNVRCVAVDGTFDDCQAIVKSLFADKAFAADVDLSGVNSINWARITAQSVYYFTSAAALGAPDRRVAFTVPTGNFGDAFAGYAALRMGLPIERIVVATNANDILARTFQTGRYAKGAVTATQSPAMDIQVASNFERLYFEAVGRDAAETRRAFEDFAAAGAAELPSQAFSDVKGVFSGVSTDEATTTATLQSALAAYGELLDPHTAVALAAPRPAIDPGTPMIVLSTAHAAKFPEAVEAATGVAPKLPPKASALFEGPERFDRLPADVEGVKAYVRDFAR